MAVGRFAPSPTGELHVGNLRTALVAWLFARSAGDRFLLRYDDLDAASVRPEHYAGQSRDLEALGLDWDGDPVRQSERTDRYDAAITELSGRGLVYRCWCTRREIREAAVAPHGGLPEGAYPGTCRDLSPTQTAAREASGRTPALRLAAAGAVEELDDLAAGTHRGVVDDVVLRRADGTAAYHLACIVDDVAQGIELVVRGDDLLESTPRQLHLARLLDLRAPTYAHVPLVLGPTGARLAKRDGATTLGDLASQGVTPAAVRSRLAHSLGLAEPGEAVTMDDLLVRFDPARLPREPWRWTPGRRQQQH